MYWWIFLVVFAAYVQIDGYRRGLGYQATVWALGTLLFCVFVAPFYFAKRPLREGEVREGGMGWNVLKNFALQWTVAMAIIVLVGILNLGTKASEVHSEAQQAGFTIGAALGLGMLGALWFFPMFGALALGIFLKRSSLEEGPKSLRPQIDPQLLPLSRMMKPR